MLPSRRCSARFATALLLALTLLLPVGGPVSAQAPADPNRPFVFTPKSYVLRGANVVVSPDHPSAKLDILVDGDRIAAVAESLDPQQLAGAQVIDLTGYTIYAGFIDGAATRLLDSATLPTRHPRDPRLLDSSMASTPLDNHHLMTPDLRAADQWSISQDLRRDYLSVGFTAAHVVPQGRIASGLGALVSLADAHRSDALLRDETMFAIDVEDPPGDQYPSTTMGAMAHLRQTLYDAAWQRVVDSPADPVWTAFHPLLDKTIPALFRVASSDDLARALSVSKDVGFGVILLGVNRFQRHDELLLSGQVAVLVDLDFGAAPKRDEPANRESDDVIVGVDPQRVFDDRVERRRQRFELLRKLREKRVTAGITTRGLGHPEEALKMLREAVTLGLPASEALDLLTRGPADVLEVKGELGTIEVGKLAHLTVMNGPLTHEKSVVRHVFIGPHHVEFHRDAALIVPDSPAVADVLTGRWDLRLGAAAADGGELELTQHGSEVTGRFESDQADGTVTGQVADDRTYTLTIRIGAGAKAVVLELKGRLENDALTGSLSSPFGGPTEVTAQRRAVPAPGSASAQANAGSSAVTLSAIEAVEGGTSESSVADALLPANRSVEPAPVEVPAGQWPTELWSDRYPKSDRQSDDLLLTGGVIHDGNGQVFQGDVSVVDGEIVEVGPGLAARPGQRVIAVDGQHIIPGVIDTHSHMMLGRGLNAVNEMSRSIVCEVRTEDIVATDDVNEYRALAGGVTTARLLHGSANTIGGQHVVVQLKLGEDAPSHMLKDAPAGVKFALGENVKRQPDRFPTTRLGVEAVLQRAFVEALEYRRVCQQYEQAIKQDPNSKASPVRRDLRLEALVEILNHERFIHCHSYRADEILMLLRVADAHHLTVRSLQHVLEGYKVAPEIAAHGASCSTFSDWWAYKVEAYDAVPQNAALLNEAGANTVLKSDDFELIRHMTLEAGKCVRYGNVPPETALQFVTRNPARELGIDSHYGQIAVGYRGDLAVFNGHPLSSRSRCELTIIGGRVFFERSRQPTAMTVAQQERSRRPRELVLPEADARRAPVVWGDMTAAMRVALVGATVHPMDAPVIPSGTVVVDAGKVVSVSADGPPADCRVVDVSGLHIYPGLIDAGSTLGLVEINAVRPTLDVHEVGTFQPDLRAGVAINPDSELIPVARAGGITHSLLLPAGGTITGQATFMQLHGWTAPEHVIELESGLRIEWPDEQPDGRRTSIAALREFVQQARSYDQLRQLGEDSPARPIYDPRFEAMRPYLHGERLVLIEAESREQILEALRFATREKLRIVLTGATDGWKVATQIAEAKVPVIVGPVQRAPLNEFDPHDAPYANPGRLVEAGVTVGFRSMHAANSRNAPFGAGVAVAYGLDEEVAERAVTLTNAEILGVSGRCGSLTAGKDASLVVTDGSPLEPTTQILGIMIQGVPFRPESRQTHLYERYRARLKEVRGKAARSAAGPDSGTIR